MGIRKLMVRPQYSGPGTINGILFRPALPLSEIPRQAVVFAKIAIWIRAILVTRRPRHNLPFRIQRCAIRHGESMFCDVRLRGRWLFCDMVAGAGKRDAAIVFATQGSVCRWNARSTNAA
jgi:hypothetical protein